MIEITLIRHGQANTGARSEADYDRLSDLGRQQALWLGEHLRATGGFDRVALVALANGIVGGIGGWFSGTGECGGPGGRGRIMKAMRPSGTAFWGRRPMSRAPGRVR